MDGFSRDMVTPPRTAARRTPRPRAGPGAAAADGARGAQLRLGTLTGFQYFSCYLRGREELLVTINRESPTVEEHPSRSRPAMSRPRVRACGRLVR